MADRKTTTAAARQFLALLEKAREPLRAIDALLLKLGEEGKRLGEAAHDVEAFAAGMAESEGFDPKLFAWDPVGQVDELLRRRGLTLAGHMVFAASQKHIINGLQERLAPITEVVGAGGSK
jgi:hypothetical protein